MPVYKATDENIARAAEIIRSGGLVSFPTETVYGLGADALNPVSVARIFQVKERPFFDPLIVHLADLSELGTAAREIAPAAKILAEKFWPGPLTLVLPRRERIPDIVTSGLDTVACRVPSHPVARKLISLSETLIAAPSANPFGYLSPTRAEHVESQLGGKIEMVLDGGPSPVGVESTIVKIENDEISLLRPGGIPVEEIEKVAGKIRKMKDTITNPESPGQLDYHYSPSKRVKIMKDIDFSDQNACFLLYKVPDGSYPKEKTVFLSREGNLVEAAANLFTHLHALDKRNCSVIIAEEMPQKGLGRAIMDRLIKASKKTDEPE